MGGLLKYSALTTKIRAMQSQLITIPQLQEMSEFSSVEQITAYLKKVKEYKDELADVDESRTHRASLERLMHDSVLQDYSKIYHFADKEQRRHLKIYVKRFEIEVIKSILTGLLSTVPRIDTPAINHREFFDEYTCLNVAKLVTCQSMDEFIAGLKETEYYKPLSRIAASEKANLFDYENALDIYFFSMVWRARKKHFSRQEQMEITINYGEQIDLLNLRFIQRSKFGYHLETAQIRKMLIPFCYKIKDSMLSAMLDAPTEADFLRIFKSTYYGTKADLSKTTNLEEIYSDFISHTLKREAARNPYSIAVVYSYLYNKELETDRLTTLVECVRYGVSSSETMRYINSL